LHLRARLLALAAMTRSTGRLDNFTDAAFAFALSLLVIGKSDIPTDLDKLNAAIGNVPIFAIGFAILAMFWLGHVRWREYRGDGGSLSTALTFLLVFLVLIYVPPLQAMSTSFANYLGGGATRFRGDLPSMFALYGAGFVAMSAVLVALFLEAAIHLRRAGEERWRGAWGECGIWSILVVTGCVSVLLALIPATARWSPFAYATLPLTIPFFAARYRWTGRGGDEA
jgi:uncharacterized membrane protein